jgi:hypothetical protein
MVWLLRPRSEFRALCVAGLPGLVIYLLVVGGVAYSNAALTNNPLHFGYDLNMERQGYGVFPGSRTVGTETDLTARQTAFYERTRSYVASSWTPAGFLFRRTRNVTWTWVFLIGPLLSFGLFQWFRVLGVTRLRPALPGLAGFGIVAVLNPFPYPHYYSGVFGFLLLFAIGGIRVWCVRHRVPASMTAGSLLVAAIVVLGIRAVAGPVVSPAQAVPIPWLPYNTPLGFEARQRLEEEVARAAPALVLVRHAASEPSVEDWVYNDPDPARSPVVWANDRGPTNNVRTAHAYPGRRWFCVEIEGGYPRRADCETWAALTTPIAPPETR